MVQARLRKSKTRKISRLEMRSAAIKKFPKERIGKVKRERRHSSNKKAKTKHMAKKIKVRIVRARLRETKTKNKNNEMRCAVQYVRFPGGPPPEY